MKKIIAVLVLAITLGACSGGTSTPAIQGSTSNIGLWALTAIIAVILDGAVTNINHTTVVDVHSNGLTLIRFTDSDCALSIFVNGNTMTYTQQCTLFSGTAPCILTLTSRANMSSSNLSGNFGPESFVCTGSAVSYAGNLTGQVITEEELDTIIGGGTEPTTPEETTTPAEETTTPAEETTTP